MKIIDKLLCWETDFNKVTDFLLYPIHRTVCLSHVLLLVVMLYVQYCEINIVLTKILAKHSSHSGKKLILLVLLFYVSVDILNSRPG